MKTLTPVKRYLLIFCVIFLALLISIGTGFYLAVKPKLDAEKTATQLAIKKADLSQTTLVDLYNGSQTYYSVYGKTKSGDKKIVSVGQDNGQIYIYNVDMGISRQAAKSKAGEAGAKEISKVVFGITNGTAIWEVTASNGYYLISFKTGELIKREGV